MARKLEAVTTPIMDKVETDKIEATKVETDKVKTGKEAQETSRTSVFADLDKLRKESVVKVRRRVLTTTVPLGKPPPDTYFRCHPDLCLDGMHVIKTNKGSNDFYFVTPSMLEHPLIVKQRRRVTIALTYIWPSGEIGVWPVPDPPKDSKLAAWKSSRGAYEQSKTGWVQLVWNEDRMDFDVLPPEGVGDKKLPEPVWPPDLDLSAKLTLAFDGRVIENDSHPYMLQLRGILDVS
jgi:hypothetical protein